jgi:hypothetical protein
MFKNLTNRRFGRLLVVDRYGTDSRRNVLWDCLCDCGRWKILPSNILTRGQQSCGCLQIEAAVRTCKNRIKHGHSRGRGRLSPEYISYSSAKQRCNNPNNIGYKNYGGRGIRFLFTGFEQFFAEIGIRPSAAHTLDRYPDKNGNYEPGNVRWATKKEQANNRRTSNSPNINSSTGLRGVTFDKSRNKFVARITLRGREHHIGRFSTAKEASEAYLEKKQAQE